ncbi:glycoside hydrolase family 6 protein [Catellatospora tritici]|uniref:glycoside hydrolase family 6 protein n=1 Tax=Catellatospora tritici TaxID=2851566 RepID=UPI001C2D5874|nr:glycoside hydrolase family 6 protein [Catellatospora tritici]MBV1854334.1 glycoside hydrolase family 6 protein [Catellatospora tritici]
MLALAGCAARPDGPTQVNPAEGYVRQRHPFYHAKLFVDPQSAAAIYQSHNRDSAWLDPITKTPQAVWMTSEHDLERLPTVVRSAAQQEALLVVVAYFIPNRDCQGLGATSPDRYRIWISSLLTDLGKTPAAIIMEPDALAADCFSPERAALIAESVKRLTESGHYVYLDAGHPQWRTTAEAARRLVASGIKHANGFSTNVANRYTTAANQQWAQELSSLVGDREYVIDTSRNGIGPPPDEPGHDDEWCNPRDQALGSLPAMAPLFARNAALLWIKRPGESDGPCRGESGFDFSPAQARTLIDRAALATPTPHPEHPAGILP